MNHQKETFHIRIILGPVFWGTSAIGKLNISSDSPFESASVILVTYRKAVHVGDNVGCRLLFVEHRYHCSAKGFLLPILNSSILKRVCLACIADGGWIGRTCSSDLRLRFKSDSLITASGWKVKWILRPKEDCDCWCNN